MDNIEKLLQLYSKKLESIYDTSESKNIASILFEYVLECDKAQLFLQLQNELTAQQINRLEIYIQDLLRGKPIQYVLGEADFYGLKFKVNPAVLIPRPETEELVNWILSEHENTGNLSILDIGTGSACIPIFLKKHLPNASLYAVDISESALDIAQENAIKNSTNIDFKVLDILDKEQWERMDNFDIIVSNPPYVLEKEKEDMADNVLAFEPHLALFVKDYEPLLFYDAIADFAKIKLNTGGKLYFEINEAKGEDMKALLNDKGAKDIQLKKDINGKARMIACTF